MKVTLFKPNKFKAHSITGWLDINVLNNAFKKVKENKGAPGVDNQSIQEFRCDLRSRLISIIKRVRNKTYFPSPLRRTYVPKPNGKKRPLGIPTIRDRVLQESIRCIIEPLFEPQFHDCSFGFRPGRSCHDAIDRIMLYKKLGYKFVVDADIVGCFDNIPFNIIMKALATTIADGNILTLIERFLNAGINYKGKFKESVKGTPQGGPASPLLCNIVLNAMDWQFDQAGYRFVRYADDFVILCKSRQDAQEAYEFAGHILSLLGLEISKEKSKITSFKDGFDFLGFRINNRGYKMKEDSVERFKHKIRDITTRCHNLDEHLIKKLQQIAVGTVNYFGYSDAQVKTQFKGFDEFIRRRIRCMKKKRIWHTDNWRIPNKRIYRWGIPSMVNLLSIKRAIPP